jgi:signal transduction histidine kinase
MSESTAMPLDPSLAGRRTEAALVERVKELTCLHGVARAVGRHDEPLAAILEQIVALLPPAWQYPDVTRARIVLDGTVHATAGEEAPAASQAADILVAGRCRGSVTVSYADARPPADEGPFLREERALLDSIAQEVSLLVERRTVEAERQRLQEQLRHADRLATIGQLAAGVAHELNEPLAAVLGFAQLCRKQPGLPAGAVGDLDRIVSAALHAREIVRKLILFAREQPPERQPTHLARIFEEAMPFLDSRARQAGVEIRRRLAPDLPVVLADPSQLTQVLVNLVVNAIQAMPEGGALLLEAYAERGIVVLAVEDHGVGMGPETVERIFEPFFTTKDVGEGTGLGLSVVHGIVTAHGGRITVRSEPGVGTRFEVRLPAAPADGVPGAKEPA